MSSNNKDDNDNNNNSMINISLSDIIIYSGIIIFLWFAFQTLFEIISHNVISASAYDFVYCFNQVTNSTFTYPEGTECSEYEIHEFVDDDLEEQEEIEDEQEHKEESGEWKK